MGVMMIKTREQKRFEAVSGFVDLGIFERQMYAIIINAKLPDQQRDAELRRYGLLRLDKKFRMAGYDECTKINIIEVLFKDYQN